MHRRDVLKAAAAGIVTTALAASNPAPAKTHKRPPNFIVILCDDLGYSDIQPFGGTVPTPAINRMAREGTVATSYYAPQNICTPSRAGLLTGRYPIRTGLAYEVIFVGDERGLPLTEKTIADVLSPDYATGLFGKWHLGQVEPFWPPTRHGFDTFFGIPYSHDMSPLALYEADRKTGTVTSSPPDMPTLQEQFYEHAERFIEANRDRPFFVELALSAPHLPEYPPAAFKGSSDAGPYGDVLRGIDAIVGRLLGKLREWHLDRDTVVIFTSDNGPWFEGKSTPLRDRKGGPGYDGGYRVPFIAWAPGLIQAGRKTDALISGIDLLPTFCAMAGRALPDGVTLDGRDISAVLTDGAASPHEEILLFNNEDVVGVRTQRWKLVDETMYRGFKIDYEKAGYHELYDESRDVTESYSVAQTYPQVMQEMQARLNAARERFAAMRKGVPPIVKKMMQMMQQQD